MCVPGIQHALACLMRYQANSKYGVENKSELKDKQWEFAHAMRGWMSITKTCGMPHTHARTILCVRPGNRPQRAGKHRLIRTLDEVFP